MTKFELSLREPEAVLSVWVEVVSVAFKIGESSFSPDEGEKEIVGPPETGIVVRS